MPSEAKATEIEDRAIILFVDTHTGQVQLEFPTPVGGVPEPTIPAGKQQGAFDPMTPSQRAYHLFWEDGTRERIKGVMEASVGQHKTLRWLLGLRCMHIEQVLGYRYDLRTTTKKAEFETLRTLNKNPTIRPLR